MVGIARPGGPPEEPSDGRCEDVSSNRAATLAQQCERVPEAALCWRARRTGILELATRFLPVLDRLKPYVAFRKATSRGQLHATARSTAVLRLFARLLRVPTTVRRYLSVRRASFPHRPRRQPASIIQQARSVLRLERLAAHARQPYLIAYTCVGAAPTEDSVRHTSTPLGFGWTLASFGETAPQGVSQ
jgi:hypothetical protein